MGNKEQVTSKKLEDIRDLLNKYRALKNEISSVQDGLQKEDSSGIHNSFVRRKTKPGVPSMLDSDYKQGGFVHILLLSFFTLFFEGLFLLLSYFIFS